MLKLLTTQLLFLCQEELEEELDFIKHEILKRGHVEHQHGEIETILLEHLIE